MDRARSRAFQTRRQILNTPGLLTRLQSAEAEANSFRLAYLGLRIGVLATLAARLMVTLGEAHVATCIAFKWLTLLYAIYNVVSFVLSTIAKRPVPPAVYIASDTAFAGIAYLLTGDPESDLFILLVLPVLVAVERLRRNQAIVSMAIVIGVLFVCIGVTASDRALRSDDPGGALEDQPIWLVRVVQDGPYSHVSDLVATASSRGAMIKGLTRVFLIRAGLLLLVGLVGAYRLRNERINHTVLTGFVKALPDEYLTIGIDNQVVTAASPGVERLIGRKVEGKRPCWEELFGRSSRDDCESQDDCLCRQLRQLTQGKDESRGKLSVPATGRHLEYTLAPVRDDDEVAGGVILLRDITLRTEFESYLSRALDTMGEAADALRLVAGQIQAKGFDRVRVYRYDPSTKEFVGAASSGMEDIKFDGWYRLAADNPYTTEMLKNTDLFTVHQRDDNDPCREHLLKSGAPDWVDIPLRDGARIHGMVSADNAKSQRPVDEGRIRDAIALTQQASRALSDTEALTEAARQVRLLAGLLELAEVAERHASEQVVMGLILTAATARGGLEFNRAVWYARRHRSLVCEHAIGSLDEKDHLRVIETVTDDDLQVALRRALDRDGAPDSALLAQCSKGRVTMQEVSDLDAVVRPQTVGPDTDGVLRQVCSAAGMSEAVVLPVRDQETVLGIIVADAPFTPGRRELSPQVLTLFAGLASEIHLSCVTKARQHTLLQFAGHDFTNCVTLARLALEEYTAGIDRDKDQLGELSEYLARLSVATRNLRRQSEWERGGFRGATMSLDIQDEVAKAIGSLDPIAKAGGRRFVSRVPEGLRIDAQEMMLESILINLLHNATKWAERDTDVTVDCVCGDDDSGTVLLTVENTGEPISDPMADAVNEGKPLPTEAFPDTRMGPGIGLELVRNFVREHGGTFRVEPTETGTRARVSLPKGAT